MGAVQSMPVGDLGYDGLITRLAPFLSRNPDSTLQENPLKLLRPWGDNSIEIEFSPFSEDPVEALNSVLLPPRFSALWHHDVNDLEFIYGAIDETNPIRGRAFNLQLSGKTFECEFREPSNRLLLIAQSARFIFPDTSTNYRNIADIKRHVRRAKERPDSPLLKGRVLSSFWIRNIEYDEGNALTLAKTLNFYMRYFDRRTPAILIHEEPADKGPTGALAQYPFGDFPGTISARPLDSYMLGLWESAIQAGDPFRRFLYSYQIIEYAAFYYMQESIFAGLKKILASPQTPSRLDEAAREIAEVMVDAKMDDEAKLVACIKQMVDPCTLWREIEPNINSSCADATFDGGFVLPALLRTGWTVEDFKSSWLPKFPDSIRKNAQRSRSFPRG